MSFRISGFNVFSFSTLGIGVLNRFPTGRFAAMAREFLELRLEPIWQSSTSDDEFFFPKRYFFFYSFFGGKEVWLHVCLVVFWVQLFFNVGMKRIRRFFVDDPGPILNIFEYCLANAVYTEG